MFRLCNYIDFIDLGFLEWVLSEMLARPQLEEDCKKALAQIEEKKYGVELNNFVKVGMSFYRKELEVLIEE